MKNSNGYPWKYSLFMAAYYLSSASFMSYIGVYLRALEISTSGIGLLTALIPMVSILSQPLLGSLSDRSKSRTHLLSVIALVAAGAILLLYLGSSYWYLALVFSVFAAFYTALQPLGDSIALEALDKKQMNFGPIRLVGCLSFALSSPLLGLVVRRDTGAVPWLTSLALALTAASCYALPEIAGHRKERDQTPLIALLRQRELAPLLALTVLLQITMGYFYSFYSVWFVSLPGGGEGILGWSYLISSLSELPFLLLCDKLFEKLGAGKLLLTSALALILRYLVLGMTESVPLILVSQALHGWGVVVITTSMAQYLSACSPCELKARSQTLLAVVGYGVARVVGSLGGGLLANRIGISQGFYACAALCALALLIFTPRYLFALPLNGKCEE